MNSAHHWKWAALVAFTTIASFVLLEAAVRIYFSVRVAPDVLLWGTQWHRQRWQQKYMRGQNVFEHTNAKTGYSKYFPYQRRTDVDLSGVPFTATINKYGYRGHDYEIEKPPGVLRVITLGASSTFGFTNRDDETYPHYLEAALNNRLERLRCPAYNRAEVINLGIPHLDTQQIYALFCEEGMRLKPDMVTVYAGYNNTRGLGVNPWLKYLSRYSLSFNFLRVLSQQYSSVTATLIEQEISHRTDGYLKGFEDLARMADQQGIAFFPITQQVRTLSTKTLYDRHLSYREEIEILRERLDRQGARLSRLEGKMLIHGDFTKALNAWVRTRGLFMIDGIGALDEHRHLLATYVHLTPSANRLLAEAIGDALINRLRCP